MQVLVRVRTRQRASQAYDAQIPAIKLTHEVQNYRGQTSCIAERRRSPRHPKKKMPHSSRASEGSRTSSYPLDHAVLFSICHHGINRKTRLAVFVGAARVEDKQHAFAPK
jgi:hypothetical protein